MKNAEALLLAIPGVTEAQVFAKLLVRCEFPMNDETIIALQEAQDWIEHETGWKVEMTISAGKRPESVRPTHNEGLFLIAKQETVNELAGRLGLAKVWKRTSNGNILIHEPLKEDNDVVHTEDV